MRSKSRLALAFLAGASLVVASCGGDDGSATTEAPSTEAPSSEAPGTEAPATDAPEALTASDVGVTETTITIGIAVSDLEAVRAKGISIPDTLTTDHLFDRWQVFFNDINDAGGINGRTVELTRLVWDPLDQTTFDGLCTAATIDNELFLVMNGTGLSGIARQCLIDAGVPVMYGDVMSQAELDTGLAVTLSAPAEAIAIAGAKNWIASGEAEPGATVGILSDNGPVIGAAGRAAEKTLTDAGYTVSYVEMNAVSGDNAAINQEGADGVAKFQADGAVRVLVTSPFTENTGFWTAAAAAGLKFNLLDTSSSGCSSFGLSRAPAAAVGSECVTPYDHATDGTTIRPDTEFEAECRANFDTNFEAYYGGKSNSGVPAGQILTDTAGKVLYSDYTPQECSLVNIFKLAMTAAGVNPTRQSFMDAVAGLGDVPIAFASNGEGRFEAGKLYAATKVHKVKIVGADTTVAADANGLYNGCAAPVNCGVVIGEWTDF